MVNHEALLTALRTALDAVVAVTTGTLTNVSVVAPDTVRRASGSFVTDGFVAGSEVLASGFSAASAANGSFLVLDVQALTMKLRPLSDATFVSTAAGASVTLRAKVPAWRAFEGYRIEKPTALRPWVRDAWRPVTAQRTTLSLPARVKEEGIYLLDLFYPSGFGTAAVHQMGLAIREALHPGVNLTAGSDRLSLMSIKPEPLLKDESWIQLPLTVQWWAFGWTQP